MLNLIDHELQMIKHLNLGPTGLQLGALPLSYINK